MKCLYLLVASLFAGAALAGATFTPSGWQLVNSAGTTDQASYVACVTALKAQPLPARSRTDYCREKWLTRVTADPLPPPPVCSTPKPADETRAGVCPAGTAGTWQQSRSSVTAAYPTCWTAGPWVPDAAPAGTCSTPPPPPDPTTGNLVYANPPTADMSALKPGDTMLLRAGTYSAIKEKSGTSAGYITVKAEVDGAVTVSGLNTNSSFIRYEGLKFAGASTKTITGDHLKFIRTAFMGGPANGNAVAVQIGTNDKTPGASNILLEDSWIYGPGGRYKVLVYNSKGVALRRVLVRHDGGWAYDGDNPQGGFALYDSVDVACQDCIFADSVQGLSGFEAAIYLVSNSTTSQRQANVSVNGAIIINSPNNGLAAEGNGSAATYSVTDVAVLNSVKGGFNTNNKAHVLNVTRGLAVVRGNPFAAWAGTVKASACIFKGDSNASSSLTNCSSTLPANVTVLNAAGQGANIQKKIGAAGTLFGEPGYDQVLDESLWPYPNEDRIKADLDAVRVTFGAKSVSEYLQAKP